MSERFFDSAALYAALDLRRKALRITWQQVAAQAGLGTDSTLTRLGHGGSLRTDTFLRLLAWLSETDVTPYVFVLRKSS